jgi:hypothetical protein
VGAPAVCFNNWGILSDESKASAEVRSGLVRLPAAQRAGHEAFWVPPEDLDPTLAPWQVEWTDQADGTMVDRLCRQSAPSPRAGGWGHPPRLLAS